MNELVENSSNGLEIRPKDLLVIRKPDRTIHKVEVRNAGVLMGMNSHADPAKQWNFKIMPYDEAMKLPFIDENYVTSAEAAEAMKNKDDEIAELRAQLEAKTNSTVTMVPQPPPIEDPKDKRIRELTEALERGIIQQKPIRHQISAEEFETANQKIKKIINASTIEEVNNIFDNDCRVTVQGAANKRVKQLQQRDNN